MRLGWTVGLLLLAAAPASRANAASDEFDYYILDPYRPRFVKARADGVDVYRTRPDPRRRAQSFPRRKGEEKRVFLIGGSVTVLYDSVEPTLSRTLEGLLPGQVRVVNCGSTGYDSARDVLAAQEVLGYEPDLIVLMTGVNEAQPLPPRWLAKLLTPVEWLGLGGRAMRLAWRLYQGPRIAEFEGRLGALIRLARAKGVVVALCTLPVNVRDMPPTGMLPEGDPDFQAAYQAWEAGRWRTAAEGFRLYLERRPDEPFGHFYLAKSLDRAGDPAAARAEYRAAWELSGHRSPVPRLNESLRLVAGRESALLVDLERAFESISPHGLVGRNLIEDDMHWYRELDPFVSLTMGKDLCAQSRQGRPVLYAPGLWKQDWWRDNEGPIRTAARAFRPNRRISWTIFRNLVWEPARITESIFSERLLAMLGTIHQANPALLAGVDQLRDWLKGQLSSNAWDPRAAANLDSWWPAFLAHVGEFYRRSGRPREALAFFDEALRLEPGLEKVRLRRRTALAQAGRAREAAAPKVDGGGLGKEGESVWGADRRGERKKSR